jgi:GDP-D-mannose dehydratase
VLKLLGKEDMPVEKDISRIRPEKSEVKRLISDNTIATKVCGWHPE